MPPFRRSYPEFALCGLNCGLCPRHYTAGPSRCPGCGGQGFDKLHPTCPIITCSQRHGGVEYCHECSSYPCGRYQTIPKFDSFITYQSRLADQKRALEWGINEYRKVLDEKMEILERLLNRFDDGRRKGFYCLAVNLLDVDTLHRVMDSIETSTGKEAMDRKEIAKVTVTAFQAMAERQGILLHLRAKPKHEK